jgi:peroxiredoxin/predicted 2-oxoglutarate/Fe(II)-dependent dioxygenase YbiX
VSSANLTPGDKVPNFFLADTAGTRRQFQGETDGRPILLLAVRAAADPTGRAALDGLSQAETELRDAGIQAFAVAGDDAATLASVAQELDLQTLLFPDANSGLLAWLLQAVGDAPTAAYLLDPNQRLLRIETDGPPEALIGRARTWFAGWNAGRGEGARLRDGAPVLVLPRVFQPGFCDKLISLWRDEHHEGNVSDASRNIQDSSKKKTQEHVIQDQALSHEIARTLHRRIGPELNKAFMYSEPYAFESFIVMSYKPERRDFFGTHRDRYEPNHPRRFAVSLNLNDDFEGGELRFPEYGPHLYRPESGGAAVFSCSLLHEALPVRSGQRFVMTAFFNVARKTS